MENDYNKQAEEFLTKTGTMFKAFQLGHFPYFDDDDQSRDVWRITLIRKHKVFSFEFGQSIANQGNKPTAYDFLSCLTKSDPGTFKEFCSDYDYSTDSIKATKVHKAVVKEWHGVNRLFGDVLDQLAELE